MFHSTSHEEWNRFDRLKRIKLACRTHLGLLNDSKSSNNIDLSRILGKMLRCHYQKSIGINFLFRWRIPPDCSSLNQIKSGTFIPQFRAKISVCSPLRGASKATWVGTKSPGVLNTFPIGYAALIVRYNGSTTNTEKFVFLDLRNVTIRIERRLYCELDKPIHSFQGLYDVFFQRGS